jgi:hypothetical protein
LSAGDNADHERAEAQVMVYMKRQHWHRQTDDEKGGQNDGHDRQKLQHN